MAFHDPAPDTSAHFVSVNYLPPALQVLVPTLTIGSVIESPSVSGFSENGVD